MQDCHTVIFDTHFTEENLKPDWGHSTPQIALNVCLQASVKRLILFHHAPEDLDSDIDEKIKQCNRDKQEKAIEVVAAREGEIWTVR